MCLPFFVCRAPNGRSVDRRLRTNLLFDRTYDLAPAILHEEVEHEGWFSEYLGEEGPSGHFRRQGTGFEWNFPHVRKFLVQSHLLSRCGLGSKSQPTGCFLAR